MPRESGLSDGDPVATWMDASGNGNHATQTIAASRPKYRTGVANGLPVVRFDGADDGMISPLRLPSADVSILMVINTQDLNDYHHMLFFQQSRRLFSSLAPSAVGYQGSVLEGFNGPINPYGVTPMLSIGVFSQVSFTEQNETNSILAWKDGILGNSVYDSEFPAGGFEPATDVLNIGQADELGGVSTWNGDMAEIIICPALDDVTRQKAEGYLKTKWGTS